jgi:hypothetical protein
MPSRLGIYDNFVRQALNLGYAQTSVRSYFKFMRGTEYYDKKIIVHRHDIDTDVRTARKLFEVEKKHNIKSSFYFRKATLDFDFMREIEEYGSEASYHYEEVASFAKKNHIKDPSEIRKHFPEIRNEFLANFNLIEGLLGKKLTTVASHGDFANRRLKLINHELLNDQKLRERCGIECESYDQTLLNNFDIYISDRPHPQYYYPISPFDAIGQHKKICLLTHPVQWETNWIESTKSNLVRIYEELNW